ncbi:MAG TPA: PspA/IM30 family protein [Sphingomonadaceae bacterium]|nr:PspA/IM30 family protein [Sphingomonadaceae bacterium]
MAMWKQLVALVRGSAFEAGQAVTDAKALTILDQQIRDAGAAQAKARDDMATLVAKRRMIEKEIEALEAQRSKYESSARAAMAKGDMDLARQVAERLSTIEAEVTTKQPAIADMRSAEDRMRQIISSTDGKIEAFRREIEVVRAQESVQKAQASVAASHGGAQSQLGSAAGSLKRLKEQQMIREEKFRAADELEDMRTGGDLDKKLRDAGLLGGSSSADDILARLSAPPEGEPLRLNAPHKDSLSLPKE